MLPFAWVLWTFSYSILWIKHGGELLLRDGKPVIKPEEFYRLLLEVNKKLDGFHVQKEDIINFADWIANYQYEQDNTTKLWCYWDNGLIEKEEYTTKELFELYKKK